MSAWWWLILALLAADILIGSVRLYLWCTAREVEVELVAQDLLRADTPCHAYGCTLTHVGHLTEGSPETNVLLLLKLADEARRGA